MYKIGEKVYDTSLGKTVVVTPELKASIESISFSVAEKRWVKDEPIQDAVIVEEKKVATKKESKVSKTKKTATKRKKS